MENFALAKNMTYKDAKKLAKYWNGRIDKSLIKLSNIPSSDSLAFYRTEVEIVRAGIECDYYDRVKNKYGEEKLKYREKNVERISYMRQHIIDAGLYCYRHKLIQEALDDFILYLESSKSGMFEDVAAIHKEDISSVAYYISVIYYNNNNYKKADIYADIAIRDSSIAKNAAEIKALCMKAQMKTAQDSAKYLAVVKALRENDVKSDEYFSWLMEYYDEPAHRSELKSFAEEEIKRNPDNKLAWILKGEAAMNEQKWDEAIESYKHSVSIDSTQVAALYNIGVCLNAKAQAMNNDLKNEKGKLSRENAKLVLGVFEESEFYLERVKRLDPYRNKVDWVKPLYQVYYILGEKKKAEGLAPLVTGFAR